MNNITASSPLQVFGKQVLATVVMTPAKYGHIFAPVVKTTQEAIAVSVGPDRSDIRPGDRILYRPYSTVGLDYEGEHYLLLDDDKLLAVLE